VFILQYNTFFNLALILNNMRVDKKSLQFLSFKMLKFQMLLTYTTWGSSVHNTIWGICTEAQLQQLNIVTHLENWSCLKVRGVTCFFVGTTESVSSWHLL